MFSVNSHIVALAFALFFIADPLGAAPFAYISNQLDDSISVIDSNQGKVVDTIRVSGKPAGVAVSPAGDKVYISTPEAKGFAVLDTKKREIIAKIPVSDGALGIAVSTDEIV